MRASFLLLMLLPILPLAAADAYQTGGTMAPDQTGYVSTYSHRFPLWLAAGDVVKATLEWDNPRADLDLRFERPGGSCKVTPQPDVACLAGRVSALPPPPPACEYASQLAFFGGATREDVTRTAAVNALHHVVVQAAWVSPVEWTEYSLSIEVNGRRPVVAERETSNSVRSANDHMCALGVSP